MFRKQHIKKAAPHQIPAAFPHVFLGEGKEKSFFLIAHFVSHSLCKLPLLNLISPFYWISQPVCYHPQRCEGSVFPEMGRRSFHYKFLHSAAHICWYQRAPGSDFWNTTDLSSSSAVDHLLEFLGMKVVVPGGPNEGSASGDRYNMRHLHVNYMTAWPWPDPLTGEHPHRAEQGSATQIVEIKYSLYTIFEHWKTLRLPSFYSCRNYIHFHIFEKKNGTIQRLNGHLSRLTAAWKPEYSYLFHMLHHMSSCANRPPDWPTWMTFCGNRKLLLPTLKGQVEETFSPG